MIGALGRRASAVAAGAVLIGLASAAPAAGAPPPTPAAITVTQNGQTCASQVGTLHVVGGNFNPFNDVLVTFDAGEGGQPESFATETDGFGRFVIDITPKTARPAGTYLVRVDDFRLREATATFTVPCPPTPPAPPTFNPKLVIFPPLGPPGFVTTVTGTGFPPGEPVTLQWDRGILDVEGPKPLTSDGSGSFTRQILIFHHDVRGPRALSAAPGPGATTNYVAPTPATFLVVPGTLQPGDFVNRR